MKHRVRSIVTVAAAGGAAAAPWLPLFSSGAARGSSGRRTIAASRYLSSIHGRFPGVASVAALALLSPVICAVVVVASVRPERRPGGRTPTIALVAGGALALIAAAVLWTLFGPAGLGRPASGGWLLIVCLTVAAWLLGLAAAPHRQRRSALPSSRRALLASALAAALLVVSLLGSLGAWRTRSGSPTPAGAARALLRAAVGGDRLGALLALDPAAIERAGSVPGLAAQGRSTLTLLADVLKLGGVASVDAVAVGEVTATGDTEATVAISGPDGSVLGALGGGGGGVTGAARKAVAAAGLTITPELVVVRSGGRWYVDAAASKARLTDLRARLQELAGTIKVPVVKGTRKVARKVPGVFKRAGKILHKLPGL